MKKIKYLIIFVFFIFLSPNLVLADTDEVTCSEIRNKYNEYTGVIDEYNSLVCDSVTDASTFETCKNLVYEKYSILEELYSLNDKNDNCHIDELNTLLDENSDKCSDTFSSDLKDFSNNVMNFFYVIAPFLLIIFGSIDFFKIIVNGDPKTIQKNRSNFFKRVIAFILLYFTPFIVKQILSLSVYDLTGNKYICDVENMTPIGNSNAGGTNNRVLYSGFYGIDNSLNYDSEVGGNILKGAAAVTKIWTNGGFVYFDGSHSLQYGNIKQSINNPTKGTCCATLAAAALYKANVVSESEINSIPYNGAYYIAELLDRKGWQIIENYGSLQPGDIVFMTSDANAPVTLSNGRTYNQGHVQIYAGSSRWYNAGSTDAIQKNQPYVMGDDYVRSRFSFAMRAPARKTNKTNTRTQSASTSTNTNTNTNQVTTPSTSTTSTNKETQTKSTNTATKTTSPSTTNTNTSSSTKGTNTKGTNTKNTTTKKKSN